MNATDFITTAPDILGGTRVPVKTAVRDHGTLPVGASWLIESETNANTARCWPTRNWIHETVVISIRNSPSSVLKFLCKSRGRRSLRVFWTNGVHPSSSETPVGPHQTGDSVLPQRIARLFGSVFCSCRQPSVRTLSASWASQEAAPAASRWC